MKRKIVTLCIGYLIGIIWGLCFKINIALFYVALLLIWGIDIWRVSCHSDYKRILTATVLLIIIISSFISSSYISYIDYTYNKFYENVSKDINIEAFVVSELKETEYNYSYIVKGISKEYRNRQFVIYMKKNKKNIFQYGDILNISGEFKEPNSQRNYGGFDYKAYLKSKKIMGSIFVKTAEVKGKNIDIYKLSNDARKSILKKSEELLPERTSGMLIGLLIGETKDVPENVVEDFRISSLSHLLAVSGMHVMYIILSVTYLLDRLKMSKRKTIILIILVLILFMFITGFSASVVRACIMGIIMVSAKLFYKKLDIWTSICLSLLIILIHNPLAINNIGLQLSYMGTIGIVLFSERLQGKRKLGIFMERVNSYSLRTDSINTIYGIPL